MNELDEMKKLAGQEDSNTQKLEKLGWSSSPRGARYRVGDTVEYTSPNTGSGSIGVVTSVDDGLDEDGDSEYDEEASYNITNDDLSLGGEEFIMDSAIERRR